ncbi:MAG: ABC transporter [Planctomycetes bacterium]|nr:ABC transporter [Planctomycetota bacterium]
MKHSITLELSMSRPSAVVPSEHVLRVAAMFGLGIDEGREVVIVPPMRLTLVPGRVVFVTGASGGGKSTILNLIERGLSEGSFAGEARVIRFDRLPEPADRPLVDGFGEAPLERVLAWLSLAGLNDAFVMLRRPCELSDGQRYRLRLAQAFQAVEGEERFCVVLADEFGATLDRVTAKVIARNVRRWVRNGEREDAKPRAAGEKRGGVCFVAATTHDDLLEALEPDVLIEKQAGSGVEVAVRGAEE